MTEVEQPPQNGIELSSAAEEDDNSKARPADIEQDMREMERRKRVEAIMGSKLFREELERIVDSARDGGILQQLSDIMGMPASRVGNVFKASNCMLPINDIRGVESMGYAKGEKILRCKLAATFRLLDLYGWTQGLGAQITARLKVDQEYFLVNPYGLLYHEVTASSLNKVDMQGQIVEQGTTNFGVNKSHFMLHSVVHAARPDIRCVIYIGCGPVVAISSLKTGLLPLTKDACVLGEITTHQYTGTPLDTEERDKLVRNLGPNSKVLILSNYGALCCGETIEEAFFAACHIVQACETQLKLLPVGLDNLVLIPEESRKIIYEQSRRPPEDLEKKFAAVSTTEEDGAKDGTAIRATGGAPKWRVGGAEFEALMRMLDNAGYRTGYIYRHPLIKSDPPKPRNDVELPPAVSSLGYLLEEEELLKQGIWKKGDFRKGGDRSRWLNSPNVYQKVEVLETGTPDPKKITKWVAEGSPTHSTPVRIEDPLQFVPAGTNPKEFKRLQQQIKDNRRADKISAGPQSHILEGVTWDEANRIKDATVSSAGDHVVLMGAASKGIIQRGYQHNAAVYKAPYAKNPFDNVTDDELNEYKRTVERKKKSIHGEYTDTDFSESEPLSSLQTSGAQQTKQATTTTAAVSQSEPEDVSEHQVMRIETQQAPIPSQPEVVLSDATLNFINGERSHTATNRKPPTGRDIEDIISTHNENAQANGHNNQFSADTDAIFHAITTIATASTADSVFVSHEANKENIYRGDQNIKRNTALIAELKNDLLFQRQKHKHISSDAAVNVNNNNEIDRKAEPSNNLNNSSNNKNGSGTGNGNGSDGSRGSAMCFDSISQTNGRCCGSLLPSCRADPDAIVTRTTDNTFVVPDNDSTPRHYPFRTHVCGNCSPNGVLALPSFEQAFSRVVTGHPELCTVYYDPYVQYMEPVYDTAPSTLYSDGAEPTAGLDDSENVYKKSIFCCTPAVCDSIFESLRKPLGNDLIFNIPFTTESPDQTSVGTTPRKTRADMSHKQPSNVAQPHSSPYRTVSHFGFNSPQREPQPEHKHIPCSTETKKYVPLRKSISYEEIFSSPRYVDLCENCFEKVVRLKPELVQPRTRLRNLVEFHSATADRFAGGACNAICGGEGGGTGSNGLLYPVAVEFIGSQYDYAECASSETTETMPPFSSQLEPVLEVEEVEPDSAEDPLKNNVHGIAVANALEKSASNSSFIEKIMRLNYSEESTNVNFIPSACAVSSNITLELEKLRNDHLHLGQKDSEAVFAVPETQHNNTEADAEEASSESYAEPAEANARRTSVTEIWEFVQWSGENRGGEDEENYSAHTLQPGGGAMCLYYESTKALDEGACEHVNDADEARRKETNDYHSSAEQHRRSLMSREERSRRKLVFQELWEDHISFLDGKEQNMLSDTESAIDGKQQQQLQDEEDGEVTADSDGEVGDTDELCQEAMCEPKVDVPQMMCVQQVVGIEQMMAVDHVVKMEELSVVNNRIVTNEVKDAGQGVEAEGNADVEEEIFLGRSLIVKNPPQVDTQPDAAGTLGCEWTDEEKEIESDGCQSTQTFDISSQENLFFRASELVDPVSDSAVPRMDNEAATLDPSVDGWYVVASIVEGGLVFSPSVEEFELYKQDSTILVDQLEIVEQDDVDFNFTDLVESAEQEDLQRLSDDFDEILLRVENLQIASVPTNTDSEPKNSKEETEYSAADEDENIEFDPVERKILKKIKENQLKESEEIFNKIETTIRSKLTPSKMELLAQSRKKQQNVNTSSFVASTPAKLATEPAGNSTVESNFDSGNFSKVVKTHTEDETKIDGSMNRDEDDSSTLTPRNQSFNSAASVQDERSAQMHNLRRSRSLTPFSSACEISPPPRKLNKTTTPPQVPGKSTNTHSSRKSPQSSRSIPEIRSDCTFSSATTAPPAVCKRNFILENIRNAAIPRNNVKRLQGNAQAIFCKSPFGPASNRLHPHSPSSSQSSNVSSGTTVTFNNQNPHNSSSARDTSPVYTFQSKLVRGSPRFWVSMSQPTPKKLQLNRSLQKRRKKHQRQQQQCLKLGLSDSTSTCTLDDEKNAVLLVSPSQSPQTTCTGVDLELEALDEQIQQIQPRLETYKRKIHDYGEHVAKCSRHMDECISVQSDIADEHRQLREEIMLNQYAEQVTCQVQTFSISEAED